jgi:hypothetical protein
MQKSVSGVRPLSTEISIEVEFEPAEQTYYVVFKITRRRPNFQNLKFRLECHTIGLLLELKMNPKICHQISRNRGHLGPLLLCLILLLFQNLNI